MVSAQQITFNEFVTLYNVKWKDQAKIKFIITSQQRPPSEPPKGLNIASPDAFCAHLLDLWERWHSSRLPGKTAGTTDTPSGDGAQSTQKHYPSFRDRTDAPCASASDSETRSRQSSDPAQIPGYLPQDHPVAWEAEARGYYRADSTPPFTVHKRSNEREREVDIPAATGLRSECPTKAKIVRREWSSRLTFWTLDLDGKRHIVKAFNGAPKGGAQYKRWTGPYKNEDDEWKGPIAFSHLKSDSSDKASAKREDEQRKYRPGSGDSTDHNGRIVESAPSESGSTESFELETNRHPHDTEESAQTQCLGRIAVAPLHRKSDQGNRCNMAPNSATMTKVHIPLASNPVGSRRESEGRLKRQRTATPLEPAKRRKDESYHSLPDTEERKQLTTTQTPQVPRYKQECTTLRFYLKDGNRFRSVRLRDCLTTSDFCACIVKHCHIAWEEVAEVRVALPWMGCEMTMDFGKEADMEMLMEEIINAPVWDQDGENGRCVLDVHVHQAEPPGESEAFRYFKRYLHCE